VGLLIYVSMDIWATAILNVPQVHYFYDTGPGIIVLIVRCFLSVYFFYNIFLSIKTESIALKKRFYVFFGLFSSVWFLYLPLFVLFALNAPNYSRDIFVTSVAMTADFIAWTALTILMLPPFIKKLFVVEDPQSLIFDDEKEDQYGGL